MERVEGDKTRRQEKEKMGNGEEERGEKKKT